MATITKKLMQVLYVGTADLTLSSLPTGVKSAIKLIRQLNPGGTGYVSFNPASGVNALTTAKAPTPALTSQYIVESVSATPNYQLPDFAFVVAGSAGGITYVLPTPKTYSLVIDEGDPELVSELDDYVGLDLRAQLSVANLTADTTLEFSLNDGPWQDLAATNTALLALTDAAVELGALVRFRFTRTSTDAAAGANVTATFQR